MTIKDTHNKSATVDSTYNWRPIDQNAPLGTKVQLINRRDGVADRISHQQAKPEGQPMSTIHSILMWQRIARPFPDDKARSVAVGVHFEEFAEMLEAVTFCAPGMEPTSGELSMLHAMTKRYADNLKSGELSVSDHDRMGLLDSLCDQIVTAVGVAHMFGFDIQGALDEVNRSNYSKFVDGKPQFDANGKIAKPASYTKPRLEPFAGIGVMA